MTSRALELDLITYERATSHIKLIDAFLKQIADSSTMVDLGCGKGIYFQYLVSKRFKHVIGIDIDKRALQEAKSRYSNVNFIVADAQSIPLRSSSTDIIILAELLEHLNSPEMCLKECYRILKEKGVILVSVPWLFEIYKPLSAVALRTLTVFKKTGNPPLLLRILFKINRDGISRRRVLGFLVEYIWKFARHYDKSFNRVFVDNPPRSPEEYILRHKEGSLFNDQHKIFMTPKEWVDMIKVIGFNVLDIDGTFTYPPLLWRFKITRLLLHRISQILPKSFRVWLSQTLIIFAQK